MLHTEVKREGINISYDVIIEIRMDYLRNMKYISLLHLIIGFFFFEFEVFHPEVL